MKVYQEITLRPSPEIPNYFLWEKLFQQIHLALVEAKTVRKGFVDGKEQVNEYSEYGVSFPQYNNQLNALGCQLRVFAKSEEKMDQLNLKHWLKRLLDYCSYSQTKTVPENTKHSCFQRRQFVANSDRLARRRAKRKHETFEQAQAHYSGFNAQISKLPYIHVQSLSNDKRFRLFIEQEILSQEETGQYSCYGLSKTTTVPWF